MSSCKEQPISLPCQVIRSLPISPLMAQATVLRGMQMHSAVFDWLTTYDAEILSLLRNMRLGGCGEPPKTLPVCWACKVDENTV